MATEIYKFGDLIELTNEKNTSQVYGVEDAIGVNIDKVIVPMRGDNAEKEFSNFHLVPPRHFAYNPRGSRKLGLGYNNTKNTYIITFNDNVFRVKKSAEKKVLDTYLFMYLCRQEWDRFAEYISWGSSTEVFDWKEFCDISIALPDINVQQKYVQIYESMVANQKSYEQGLDDLKLACSAYIEELRRQSPCEKIGDYISFYNEKNSDEKITLEQGVNIKKEFITPQRENSSLASRKIVRRGHIVYCTQLNNENVAVALRDGPDCVVSPVYDVVEVSRPNELMAEYLLLWMQRPEFGRFVYWASKGTSYEFLSPENLQNYKIPIPDIKVQKSIADIYKVYTERKRINEQLKQQIKDICPILIKGSLEE